MFPALDELALEYDTIVHFTPTQAQRKTMAGQGVAMPDGSFYIRNRSELSDAINAVGRATPNANESETARRNSVRRHIIKRASALSLSNMIPDTWNSDGSLKQTALSVEDFIAHFGVRGMRWGVHRSRSSRAAAAKGKASSHVAPDAARAKELSKQVKRHGTQSLSNKDLQELVTRMNLESQHGKLKQQHVSEGEKFVKNLAKDVAKQQATSFISQYGPKAAMWLVGKGMKYALGSG